MTEIIGALNKIMIEEVRYRSAVSESTLTKIGAAINFLQDNASTQIGDIQSSILTEAQFQSLRSTKWVLMDGRSVVGSDYETLTGISNIPDMVTGQRFLGQAANSGALGSLEASQNKAHTHTGTGTGSTTGIFELLEFGTQNAFFPQGLGSTPNNVPVNTTLTINSSGETVARPETLRVNFFIKINN